MAHEGLDKVREISEHDDVFWAALLRANRELESVKEQEKELALKRAQLNETIKALIPLVIPEKADINSLSLPNAIRVIFNGLDSDRYLTAVDVKTKLLDLGFDLSKYGDNPQANITATINRMAENDELRLVVDGESQKKKFEAGPELKSPPQVIADPVKDLFDVSGDEPDPSNE
jgi:hypothetical protein